VASVFRNQTRERNPEFGFLQVKLSSPGKNARALGAKVRVYCGGKVQYVEQVPARGFQSCMSDRIHFGLGKAKVVDSVKVTWMSGQETVLMNIAVNQLLKIQEKSKGRTPARQRPRLPLRLIFPKSNPPVNYAHAELGFNDFKRQGRY